jgi:hypothetical protein
MMVNYLESMDVLSFEQEAWLQVLGATAGALFTIMIGWGAVSIDRWRNETAALNALVAFIGQRRALSRPRSLSRQVLTRTDDVDRCIQSVLSIRDEARLARNRSRLRSQQVKNLDEIVRLCNRYTDALQSDPRNYRRLLSELQRLLNDEIRSISRKRHRVRYVEPGSTAL